MIKTMSITNARNQLPTLVDNAATLSQKTFITVNGKVSAAIVNADELEEMQATIEVISDTQAMKDIHQSEKDIDEGRVISWEKVKTTL